MIKNMISYMLFVLVVSSILSMYLAEKTHTLSTIPSISNSDTWIGETIYIKSDGKIDPPDAPLVTHDNVTYIVTKNIQITGDYGIVVERNNVVIDGNGYYIQGQGSQGFSRGIYILARENVTIRNFIVKNFHKGIDVFSSKNIFINNNTVVDNENIAISIAGISSNIVIKNNIIENNSIGLVLGPEDNRVVNNVFINCGLFRRDPYGNIILNNTVNGESLIYRENISDTSITGEAGQVIVNGVKTTISELAIDYMTVEIISVDVEDSHILNNRLINNHNGIYLRNSNNIRIFNNTIESTITHSEGIGIFVISSNNIFVSSNVIKNYLLGIYLFESINNSIVDNKFINCGLFLTNSYGNKVVNNTVNNKPLIYLEGVSNVKITGEAGQVIVINSVNIVIRSLDVRNTTVGIMLVRVDGARVLNNYISNSYWGVIMDWSKNSLITNNTIENNILGISMRYVRDSRFESNTIKYNTYGLFLSSSQDNAFLYNNFINNSEQIVLGDRVGSNTWDDGVIGNYWSSHECLDSDNNGVCENPYVIREPDNIDRYPSRDPFIKKPTLPQTPPTETTPTLTSEPASTPTTSFETDMETLTSTYPMGTVSDTIVIELTDTTPLREDVVGILPYIVLTLLLISVVVITVFLLRR